MKNKNGIIVVLAVVCALLLCGVGYTLWQDKEEEKKLETVTEPDKTAAIS